MEKKLGQEPAFSRAAFANEYGIDKPELGMSKHFYAACAAMQGLIAGFSEKMKTEEGYIPSCEYQMIAQQSLEIAAELIKQEMNSHE